MMLLGPAGWRARRRGSRPGPICCTIMWCRTDSRYSKRKAEERECLRPYRCRRCGLLALLSSTPAFVHARIRVRLARIRVPERPPERTPERPSERTPDRPKLQNYSIFHQKTPI